MENGYVKLWRRSLNNDWLKNPNLWVVWSYCLMKASHKKRTTKIGFQEIEIQPGQFVFGRKKASEELDMSEWKIRACIDSLRKSRNITIKTTNKFSIITIVNWHIYQSEEDVNRQQNRQQTANKPPTNRHRQECKDLKNVKKKIYGEFKNVFLTDNEIEKLQTKFNSTYFDRIETLSRYIETFPTKGKKYKSHYATILTWAKKDVDKQKPKRGTLEELYR